MADKVAPPTTAAAKAPAAAHSDRLGSTDPDRSRPSMQSPCACLTEPRQELGNCWPQLHGGVRAVVPARPVAFAGLRRIRREREPVTVLETPAKHRDTSAPAIQPQSGSGPRLEPSRRRSHAEQLAQGQGSQIGSEQISEVRCRLGVPLDSRGIGVRGLQCCLHFALGRMDEQDPEGSNAAARTTVPPKVPTQHLCNS